MVTGVASIFFNDAVVVAVVVVAGASTLLNDTVVVAAADIRVLLFWHLSNRSCKYSC